MSKRFVVTVFSLLIMVLLADTRQVSAGSVPVEQMTTEVIRTSDGAVYVSMERSHAGNSEESGVLDSWIVLFEGRNSSEAIGVRILGTGSILPGYGVVSYVRLVSLICAERDVVDICRDYTMLIRLLVTQEGSESVESGIFLFNRRSKEAKLVFYDGQEISGGGDLVWDIHDPKAVSVQGEVFIVASGRCGPSQEVAIPCVVSYFRSDLFLVASEGMSELLGRKFVHSNAVVFLGDDSAFDLASGIRGMFPTSTESGGNVTESYVLFLVNPVAGSSSLTKLCENKVDRNLFECQF